jgi:hypothetical protein
MRTIEATELAMILAHHKEWRQSGRRSGARANLAGAYLADAYLADANLADANLAGANLAGANLADANLARANLADADLADADLADAYLAGADLADANLADADLADADLADANLAGANLSEEQRDPYVRGAPVDYAAKAERFRRRNPDVPVIENLDHKILEAVSATGCSLDMSQWHKCETTHCRAGWAITLAGDAGKELEDRVGPFRAGCMLYRASTGRVPHFFATTQDALDDLRECAAGTAR